jgi:threonine dehydratase
LIELAEIRRAAERIAGRVHRTPLLSTRTLGDRIEASLHLKCESFQKTGSFKARGALNKVLSLGAAEREKGLITVSAGNHAQAVAWAAREVGAPCAVVMPGDAPRSKIEAVRGYGAEVIEHDDRPTLFDRLNEEKDTRGSFFVHPFDDAVVLAGAGTVGLEILEEMPDVDVVVVPVGGGGLLGGVTSAIKGSRPSARVVAVELEAGPGMGPALAAGKPVPVSRPVTLADGMTPPFVGALPLEIVREAVDDVVVVSEEEILNTMELLMTRCKLYVEASGAAATAALLHGRLKVQPGARTVSIVSGGNIDVEDLAAAHHVWKRAEETDTGAAVDFGGRRE